MTAVEIDSMRADEQVADISSMPNDATPPSEVQDVGAEGRRIAYLLSRYPAVSHSFLLNEVLQLRKRGFEIDVVSINPPDRAGQDLAGVEQAECHRTLYVKSMPYAEVFAIILGTLVRHPMVFLRGLHCALRLGGLNLYELMFCIFYFLEALVVGSWMRKHRHTHLHVHFGTAVATVGFITSVAWRIPYSLSIHGPDEFFDAGEFHLTQKIEHAKFALCISDFCRSQVMRITGPEHWDKLEVVRLGVDLDLFTPRTDKGEADEETRVVCVGRLVPAKGQLILVSAVGKLIAAGYAVRLTLVGDGEDRGRIQDFVRRNNLEQAVQLAGALNHEQTRLALKSADLFVLASFAEGLPVALMEAMAMEIPCISTFVAGIPELIRNRMDGLLVPSSSVEALASAIGCLIDDRQLRCELGVAGRRRVIAHHCLAENSDLLASAFRRKLPTLV
jgi:glycosyltransferase involved in cell wall biosynthesis